MEFSQTGFLSIPSNVNPFKRKVLKMFLCRTEMNKFVLSKTLKNIKSWTIMRNWNWICKISIHFWKEIYDEPNFCPRLLLYLIEVYLWKHFSNKYFIWIYFVLGFLFYCFRVMHLWLFPLYFECFKAVCIWRSEVVYKVTLNLWITQNY